MLRRFRPLPVGILLIVSAALAPSSVRAQDEQVSAPLPDVHAFLNDVRDRLHSDEFLLDQYTFNEKHTEHRLDAHGKVSKTRSALYEVYPSPEPGHTYRRLIQEDGRALSAEDLAKEDRKQEEKEAKASAKTESQGEEKTAAALERRRQKEAEAVEELFRVYEIRMVRREPIEGRDAILLTFAPRSGVKAQTRAGKILQRFAGRAWIDEEDRQLVRVEAQLVDDLSFGFGILAKLKKGATASITRRKVNDEIWLPAQARFAGQARILLVKGLRLDALSEYSDYKKFSVATETAVSPQ